MTDEKKDLPPVPPGAQRVSIPMQDAFQCARALIIAGSKYCEMVGESADSTRGIMAMGALITAVMITNPMLDTDQIDQAVRSLSAALSLLVVPTSAPVQ